MTLYAEPIEWTTDDDDKAVPCVRLGASVEVFLGEHGGKFPDGNQVVVRGKSSLAVFDMPMVAHRIVSRVSDADLVILGHVHEDHIAGLHQLPGVPVHAPLGDVAAVQSLEGLARHYGYSADVTRAVVERAQANFHFVPRPDAIGYDDGAVWELGGTRVRAIHMPGHTSGHSVLLVEPDGIAFIGDIDLSSFGPYYGDACSDLVAFRRTLEKVADVPARAWITSHHKGVVTERDRFVALLHNFAAVIERRDDALLAAIRQRPATVDELVQIRFVYPQSYNDIFVADVERRVISQHLNALIGSGRLTIEDERYAVA